MNAWIYIEPITVEGTEQEVFEIRYKTNRGVSGPRGNLYATKEAVYSTTLNLSNKLIKEGFKIVRITDLTGATK